jgi:hypothetical protein
VEDYRIEVLPALGDGQLLSRNEGAMDLEGSSTATGSFNLYPNPAKNLVNIAWMNLEAQAGHIVSTTGQVLYSFDSGNVPNQLNISELPAGMYMLQVVSADHKVVTQRFVKVD